MICVRCWRERRERGEREEREERERGENHGMPARLHVLLRGRPEKKRSRERATTAMTGATAKGGLCGITHSIGVYSQRGFRQEREKEKEGERRRDKTRVLY